MLKQVYDTNVLLHDPTSIEKLRDGFIVLPMVVIEELDTFKKDSGEKGRSARHVSRYLDELRSIGDLSLGVLDSKSGTTIQVLWIKDLPPSLKPDDQILEIILRSIEDGEEILLVSKDLNLRIKASAMKIQATDYNNDQVETDELYTGMATRKVTNEDIGQMYSEGLVLNKLYENQFVTLTEKGAPSHTALGRMKDGLLQPLAKIERYPMNIKPRNREQTLALELLLDDSIKLVTLTGIAGSGKSLLALAASLMKVIDDEVYDKLLVARPIIPMGRDLGYLPGSVDEKIRPYMQPIYDNLEVIAKLAGDAKRRGNLTPIQLEEAGYLTVEPLTYIRGRSIPNQVMLIDEAQNLTPHEVKTILTRAGDGTKVIFTGDPYQIDNPYVDASSNGLSYLVEHFKGQKIAGHVTLTKGERSELSELASKLL